MASTVGGFNFTVLMPINVLKTICENLTCAEHYFSLHSTNVKHIYANYKQLSTIGQLSIGEVLLNRTDYVVFC